MGPLHPDPAERARIEAALIVLVVDRGYAKLRLEDLLERAGLERHSAFEAHFESLDACFAETWERIDRERRERTSPAMRSAANWREGFRAALAAGLKFLAEDPERARFYVVEAISGPESVAGLRDRMVEKARETIAEGDGKPERPETLRRALADGIAGGIWTRLSTMIGEGRAAELPSELGQLMYFAVLPYFGREVADQELARP